MRIETLFNNVRLRKSSEFAESNILRLLPKGTVFANAKRQAEWWAVPDGYVHTSVADRVTRSPEPVAQPDLSDPLTVPYRSQWDTDANNRQADCGQTCVAMLAEWRSKPIHIHDLLCQSNPSGLSNAQDLVDNFKAIGMSAKTLHVAPDEGLTSMPAICLIYYGGLERRSVQDKKYKGWHWLVLLQQTDTHVIVHDPDYWQPRRKEGAQKQYCLSEWKKAFIPFEPLYNNCKTAVVLA
jgi:Peptidase C39 family